MEQQLEAREEGGNGLVLSEKRRRGEEAESPRFLSHSRSRSLSDGGGKKKHRKMMMKSGCHSVSFFF